MKEIKEKLIELNNSFKIEAVDLYSFDDHRDYTHYQISLYINTDITKFEKRINKDHLNDIRYIAYFETTYNDMDYTIFICEMPKNKIMGEKDSIDKNKYFQFKTINEVANYLETKIIFS